MPSVSPILKSPAKRSLSLSTKDAPGAGSNLATPLLESARALHESVTKVPLNLVKSRSEFSARQIENGLAGGVNNGEGGRGSTGGADLDPQLVKADCIAQIQFLKKQKYVHQEQNAKSKFVKAIVSDIEDAPFITSQMNLQVQAANAEKKSALLQVKKELEERGKEVGVLASMVEEDYNKAQQMAATALELSTRILDARVSLARLRAAHPAPRLTESAALALLDEQVAEMQTLEEAKQAAAARVNALKEKVAAQRRAVERGRAERSEIEQAVEAAGGKGDGEGSIVGLYEWYTNALDLQRSLHHNVTSHIESENELRLTYTLDPATAEPGTQRLSAEVTISLVFHPGTRTLAAASVAVDGQDFDAKMGDAVDPLVQQNDAPGVVAAVLRRAPELIH